MPIRFQFEPAVQFFQPFVHSSQAHSRFPIYLSQGSQTLGSYPTSEIPNFEDGVFTLPQKTDPRPLGFRVPMDVRQALLQYPEESRSAQYFQNW